MAELKIVYRYQTANGKEPFTEWIRKLDKMSRARILIKVDRLAQGVTANVRSLGKELHELKMKFGPGFRVYFGYEGRALIILLAGGDKGSQSADIKKAREYWDDHKKTQRT